MLAEGLRGDWEELPTLGLPVANFLAKKAATAKCRTRFRNEVMKGRMLGGPGWSVDTVNRFLDSTTHLAVQFPKMKIHMVELSTITAISLMARL